MLLSLELAAIFYPANAGNVVKGLGGSGVWGGRGVWVVISHVVWVHLG